MRGYKHVIRIKLAHGLVKYPTSVFAIFHPRTLLLKIQLNDPFSTSGNASYLYFGGVRFQLRRRQTREAEGFLSFSAFHPVGTVGLP